MKRLASVITLMIASTLATAADSQVRVDESLVLAYNTTEAKTVSAAEESTIAVEVSSKVMDRTLNEVSASLGAELDARIADLMTASE
ncbi:hypothetical protein FHR99_002863 [Litorivivens lipolytica]|uniref:Uncharacterized protein n=1 Tax=Litorivivens lipolytica TaxID=1524264 RepID=A0A7W4Z6J8_9GAMM|nr:hypothetical protein [Litorivivens lipolytica]MBB3048589.1 hypothetical protein [Litorivivens lipolytica]